MADIRLVISSVALFVSFFQAHAFPELTRAGYFSCVSCHVSPSGGGVLTPYGRSFSAERLSTWARPGEEGFLHGLIEAKENPSVLVGGDVRYLQTYRDDARARQGRFFRMQSDVELAVAVGRAMIVGEVGLEPSISKDGDEPRLQSRRHYARLDVGEAVLLRAGKFHTSYGLMIPDHQRAIRRGLGFDQGQETYNAEVSFLAETHEVSITGIFDDAVERREPEAKDRGIAAKWSMFLAEKHRVGLSALSARSNGEQRRERVLTGAHGTFALAPSWFLMSEIDSVMERTASDTGLVSTRGAATFHRLGFEAVQGLIPYLVHEIHRPDLRDRATRRDAIGLGMQWFPRPHFELTAEVALGLMPERSSYGTNGYLLLHYYL